MGAFFYGYVLTQLPGKIIINGYVLIKLPGIVLFYGYVLTQLPGIVLIYGYVLNQLPGIIIWLYSNFIFVFLNSIISIFMLSLINSVN